MELVQQQSQQLSQQQLAYLTILQMHTSELSEYVQELAMENPMIELPERAVSEPEPPHPLLEKLRWLQETDPQNYRPGDVREDEFDPMMRCGTDGGLSETLQTHLARQLASRALDKTVSEAAQRLLPYLDRDGYLRAGAEELARQTGLSPELVQAGRRALQALDPAGVGAEDLAACLALQLERRGGGAAAVQIVREHLEALSRGNYRSIAKAVGVSAQEVGAVRQQICALDPRPGAAFQSEELTPYVLPDICIEREGDRLSAHTMEQELPEFTVSRTYLAILNDTQDREVRQYLQGKLQQAQFVRQGIRQRQQTLLRFAQFLADRQRAFFLNGKEALVPLRMEDAAQELGVHVSTVSRVARAKYLQCSFGVFPLSFFFSRSASESAQEEFSTVAARELLQRLIAGEDPAAPFSDQELCAQLQKAGCRVSRRTVAKYREALNIPNGYARKTR